MKKNKTAAKTYSRHHHACFYEIFEPLLLMTGFHSLIPRYFLVEKVVQNFLSEKTKKILRNLDNI